MSADMPGGPAECVVRRQTTIDDVRHALWNAYKKLAASEHGIEGKSSEGWCELLFPTYWSCETADEFCEPCGIIVFSYALGTSRRHYFNAGKVEKQIDHCTWESPDFLAKAVKVINGWANAIDT